jgi:hypothetical protein
MEVPTMNKIADRLLTLTKGWEHFHDAGFDTVQVVTLDKVEPSSTKIVLQFYPEEGSSSSITTLDLDVSQVQTPDQIAEVAERHKISVDDQLNLLNKARIFTAGKETRQKLYAIRLLAVATYGMFFFKLNADSSLLHTRRHVPILHLPLRHYPNHGRRHTPGPRSWDPRHRSKRGYLCR